MCSIITNNYKISNNQIEYINLIKKKLKNNTDNPKLKIENIIIKKNNNDTIEKNNNGTIEKNNNDIIKKIYIIQDGYLIAGTKQRVAKLFIKNVIKENKKIDKMWLNVLKGKDKNKEQKNY
jgi:hypothetical protein